MTNQISIVNVVHAKNNRKYDKYPDRKIMKLLKENKINVMHDNTVSEIDYSLNIPLVRSDIKLSQRELDRLNLSKSKK